MRNKIYLLTSILVISLSLFSCGRNNVKIQVENEIKQIKKSFLTPTVKQTNNEFVLKKYEANEAIKLRSPFETSQIAPPNQAKANKPLLLYPLNMLRFVGILTKNNKIEAYILIPDNRIFTTFLDDIIGSEGAKVIKIDKHEMQVLVQIREPGKPIKQEVITLGIKGESK